MPYSYWGQVLFVDPTTGQTEVQPVPDAVYRRYLGGYGLGVHLLYPRIPPGADPLGPENVLGSCPAC